MITNVTRVTKLRNPKKWTLQWRYLYAIRVLPGKWIEH